MGVLAGVVSLNAAPAIGQDYIAQANALYDEIQTSNHSEQIILPAIAELEPPPAEVSNIEDARLAFAGGSMWDAAREWAEGEPQQAAIEALFEVTEEQNWRVAMAFAQPYGVNGASIDQIKSGMYTELGDPPLLAAAEHKYLPAMERLRMLVHIEAARRLELESPDDAIEVLLRLAVFGRQMTDREMIVEAYWGYAAMTDALQRVRDIIYLDYTGDRRADPVRLIELIEWLDHDGALGLHRLRFPRADGIAASQMIDVCYEERGGVIRRQFLPSMVRLGSGTYPLRRFAEARFWDDKIDSQVDWWDIRDARDEVFDGWKGRWQLDPWDPVMDLPFAYDQMYDLKKYAAVIWTLRANSEELGVDIPGSGAALFRMRRVMETERVGTRLALGVVGRVYESEYLPSQLAGIRPRFVKAIEADPFLPPLQGSGGHLPMRYFIPVEQDYIANKRDKAEPHRMSIYPGDGTNFSVELFEDQFVLYSVGPNGRDGFAKRVSNDAEAEVGDYIIWPPVLSQHRKHLLETEQLR